MYWLRRLLARTSTIPALVEPGRAQTTFALSSCMTFPYPLQAKLINTSRHIWMTSGPDYRNVLTVPSPDLIIPRSPTVTTIISG